MKVETLLISGVERDAVKKRVNRVLAKKGQKLIATRGYKPDLGDFYIVDIYQNFIVDRQVDLDTYARDLGVLMQSERITTRENHGATA